MASGLVICVSLRRAAWMEPFTMPEIVRVGPGCLRTPSGGALRHHGDRPGGTRSPAWYAAISAEAYLGAVHRAEGSNPEQPESEVLVQDTGRVRRVTLNRPDRVNAFTAWSYRSLARVLDEAD